MSRKPIDNPLEDRENSEVEPREPETRRNFALEFASLLAGALLGLVPAGIGLFAFFDPLSGRKDKPLKFRSGSGGREGFARRFLGAVPVGSAPQRFPVINHRRDAWNFVPNQAVGSVYVERAGQDELRVFNTTCPHAGCSIALDGDAYNCPCHNSSFNLNGTKRDSGRENPSPRSLDELDVDEEMLQKGEIWVRYENYYIGIEQKIAKS